MSREQSRRTVNRLPPERRIADIMGAARQVFVEKGYSEAVIADIAERAGVVEGSIYRFFANKRALLQAVAEDWFTAMMAESEAGSGAVQGEWNRIHFIVYGHLNAIRRDPGLARLVLAELRPDPLYRESKLFELQRDYTRRLADVVRDGIAAGVYRANASPSLVRDMVFGAVEHHSWSFLRNEGALDVETTAREITEMIHAGLAVPAPRPAPLPAAEAALERLDLLAARLERAADRLIE